MMGNLFQGKIKEFEKLGISLTKKVGNEIYIKPTYEVLDELAKKWRYFDDKEDVYYQERFFKRY